MITSVFTGRRNADLLEYIRPMYLADEETTVLDVTYGRGNWWKVYRPQHLCTNDLHTEGATTHHDFRSLPSYWAESFGVVAFDPPYVCKGGRDTSTIDDFNDRFGLHTTPRTPEALWAWIGLGVVECARVLDRGGVLLYKTADYIYGGRYRFGLGHAVEHVERAGLRLEDVVIHVSGAGGQPLTNRGGTPRRQVHTRRAHSYLVIARKS
jgi:hypothetical protein